jgi:hypothetical protein
MKTTWYSRIFGFIRNLYRKLFCKPKSAPVSALNEKTLSFFDRYLPIAKGGKHGVHSKRPYYLKAELMAAAQAKRERRNAKRLAERRTA